MEGGVIANSLVQFCLNDTMRVQAIYICERQGINLPTAMRMSVSRMVQENENPFSMTLDDN